MEKLSLVMSNRNRGLQLRSIFISARAAAGLVLVYNAHPLRSGVVAFAQARPQEKKAKFLNQCEYLVAYFSVVWVSVPRFDLFSAYPREHRDIES